MASDRSTSRCLVLKKVISDKIEYLEVIEHLGKTKAHSAASGVVIPLNDGLLALIGQPKDGNRNQIIFPN